ncbi:MAG: tail fiber protein [Serratia inhibens]|uniref:tail fiber protein n=1 Tax=Serratia inhibens TaxID=2338073 RepID=UPI003C7A697C
MIIGFGNNVVSSLAADITATQTTIQVMPGAGALFAGLLTYDYANDSNSLKTYAKITLTDAKETVFEVCHLTAVNDDMLTVVREQEGTRAKGWSLNDVIANFATRGSENQFVQIEQLQSGHYTSAVAGGTANGLTLALPATYFLNGSTDWALKTPILIYPTLNNTGASTLQLTMGGRVMGTYPLVKGSNTALRAGDIVAKNPFLVVFNADQGRFALLNPTTSVGAVLTVNTHTPDAAGNVKLGTAADADVGTVNGNVMAVGAFGLGRGPSHKADAYNNVGEIYRVNNTSANTPTTGVAGVVCLPCDGGPSAAYIAVSNSGSAWVGSSSTPANGVRWNRVYTTAYKPTAQDTGALPLTGGTCTGQIIAPNFATTPDSTPVGAGSYGQQLQTQASFFQPNWQWPTTSGAIFVPIAKGTSTRKDRGWPTAVSYGYLMPGEDMHAHPVIHAIGDNGMESIWDFNTQTGGIYSGKAGEFATQPWVNNGLNGRVDWDTFNREVGARATTEYVNNNFVSRMQRGAQGSMTMDGGLVEAPAGCVLTGGNGNEGNQVGIALYRPLQILRGGSWVTIEG